jgi:hypothetical protein
VKVADAANPSDSFTAWTREHVCHQDYYYFNDYTMLLNHLHKKNLSEIAPTDSRLRPDQRALEYQNLELATTEKHRLEEKQRTRRKEMEKKGAMHQIKWFYLEKDEDGDELFMTNRLYEV